MARTYIAGVFLTISTYEGPQLIYNYYDAGLASNNEETEKSSDDGIEWSDEESSDDEVELEPIKSNSPSSKSSILQNGSRVTSPTSISHSSRAYNISPAVSRPSISTAHAMAGGGESLSASSKARNASKMSVSTSLSDINPLPPSKFASNSVGVDSTAGTESGVGSGTTPSRSTPRSLLIPSKTTLDSSTTEKPTDSPTLQSMPASSDFSRSRPADLPCGFDKDILAEILTPPETMCNEKFTLTVDDCLFVGIPVHILESGTWRPLRPNYLEQQKEELMQNTDEHLDDISTSRLTTDSQEEASQEEASQEGTNQEVSRQEVSRQEGTSHESEGFSTNGTTDKTNEINGKDENSIQQQAYNTLSGGNAEISNGKSIGKTAFKKLKGVVTEHDSPMRMFHVSFALIPPITEAAICEERAYRYILVPFVRMLRQEQASKNYVWEEVAKMQRVHESTGHKSASELQENMESVSELARALRKMCTAIAHMDIARILIGNKARAFQVPLQLELSQLPSWYDEVSPHSYVSTISSPLKEIGHDCYECYGLLLLDDPEVILQEIEVDPKGPVAAMIRNIEPTLSLQELALQNNIEIKQIVTLVWSLVYWRRARIIIPINARYSYGSSPLSPFGSQLSELAQAYHNLFPMMPPLQKLLALLSTGKPKPFAMHIPSTDHRHIYLRMLAWLLQKDLVTHLPTFALIVVTRKIKLSSMNTEENVESNTKSRDDGESSEDNKDKKLLRKPIRVDLRLTPEDDSNDSSGTGNEALKRKWLLKRRFSNRNEIDYIQDSVIQDPRKATPLEKKWLGQIAVSGSSRNPDLAAMFQRLTNYFNGKDCLEQVMIHERISREEMRSFMQEFSQYIITYKHW